MVKIGGEIKDAARVNLAREDRIQQFRHVGTNRSGTTTHPNITVECPLGGNLYMLRYADAPNNGPRARHGKGHLVRFVGSDALKHPVSTDGFRQMPHGPER